MTDLAKSDLEKFYQSYKDKDQLIPEESIRRITAMTAIGLDYLHGKNISHRDLKPANILMYDDQKVKICDFGLAKVTANAMASISSAGTPMYAAPELLGTVRGAKILPYKPDIYSLGLTTCYLMLGDLPDTLDIYRKAIPFDKGYSDDLKDFVYFLLER